MGFKGWKGGGKAGVLVYGFCVQGGHVVRKTSIQQGRRFSIVLIEELCVQAGHVARILRTSWSCCMKNIDTQAEAGHVASIHNNT